MLYNDKTDYIILTKKLKNVHIEMFHYFITTLLSVNNKTMKKLINEEMSTCNCFSTILIILSYENNRIETTQKVTT